MQVLDKPVAATRSGMSAMLPADIPEVASLFFKAFRQPGRTPSPAFIDYFERSFFSSPSYDQALASLVYRDGEGRLDSALAVIPMQVSVNGRAMTGRLLSNYMTDPDRRTAAGANLVLTIRGRNQDFCFSDSANPVSADHWKALGGTVLPIQSLDWLRLLRPAAWLVDRAKARLPRWLSALAMGAARPFDALLRRMAPRLVPAAGDGLLPIERSAFLAAAPQLVERFALHPIWDEAELGWLVDMAALNTADGPLHIQALRDGDGKVLACCVYYASPGGVARVLNVMCRPRQEARTIAALLHALDALGCVAAQGMAQPFLMEALGRQRASFVPRGAFCVTTRHPEILAAIKSGDAYLGGLFGEDWNRLVTDFWD